MAKEVETRLVDDLEKSRSGARVLASQTIRFAVNDTRYEIDLSEDNAAAFMRAVGPFMEAATVVPARKSGGGNNGGSRKATQKAPSTEARQPGRVRTDRDRTDAVRSWARQNGFQVSDRGRIPTEVLNAYEGAGSPTLDQLQSTDTSYTSDMSYAG